MDTLFIVIFAIVVSTATGGKQKIRIGINGKVAEIFEILAFYVPLV